VLIVENAGYSLCFGEGRSYLASRMGAVLPVAFTFFLLIGLEPHDQLIVIDLVAIKLGTVDTGELGLAGDGLYLGQKPISLFYCVRSLPSSPPGFPRVSFFHPMWFSLSRRRLRVWGHHRPHGSEYQVALWSTVPSLMHQVDYA